MTTAKELLAATSLAQGQASDPVTSAWVSANAGAGKTHVLKMRVLRLLLAGGAPERILCLTYTKAAAAEMSSRIFGELAQWATATPPDLEGKLADVLGRPPLQPERERARRLFAAAIETPGGLKVDTIHAFCERLLQRFPLEARVPPGFRILDDELARTLRREAIEGTLTAATRDRDAPLAASLELAARFAGSDQFEDVIGEAIDARRWLDDMLFVDRRGDGPRFVEVEAYYRRLLGLMPTDDEAGIARQLAETVGDDDLRRLRDVLQSGSKNDLDAAARAAAALAASALELRVKALAELLLTRNGTARENLMTKKLAAAHPDIAAQFDRITGRFLALSEKRRAVTLLDATMAMLRLADDAAQRYRHAKEQRAALDFEDLIQRSAALLSTSAATSWVLYKLDGGLDHILVDEAQDTSPRQWSIVGALADEFFAGVGTAEGARTLFAVGDEKQSIYSFQGAAPRMFAQTGSRFAEACEAAGATWRQVPLQLSFRTVAPLLEAVDRVFGDSERGRGVVIGGKELRHVALRQGQAGLIEIWPTVKPDAKVATDPWTPLGDSVATAPSIKVAQRIARTIAHWLNSGERLVSQDRPITAGDILILVRSRRPFAPAMVAELKARGIPVAGADRMHLVEQLAVQDLVALGDFLTLPEDDLALATVLKSPLFDLDDDDLLAIAPSRKGSLWSALIDRARSDPRFVNAATTLKRWRSDADYLPPFEFFAKILDGDGMRGRLLSRLGPDAADPIDELVNRAIAYDDQSPPSLLGFLTWLRAGVHEIKRDMDQTRNEVRVMTVHGAKGLEAPIVFLPDTCSAPTSRNRRKLIAIGHDAERPSETEPPLVWAVKGVSSTAAIAAGKAVIDAAETEEHRRLLYVAMTRPRDRLYVAGYEGAKQPPQGCWYDLITAGIGDLLQPATAFDGATVLRYEQQQIAPHDQQREMAADADAPLPLPDWARRPAPREGHLVMPLAPSRLAPLETDDAGEPVEVSDRPRTSPATADLPTPSPLKLAGGDRFLRGTITHALLEHLPGLPRSGWERAATEFVARRAATLGARTRSSIVAETLAVLNEPAFATVFGPDSQAEVPIVGEIDNPAGRGAKLRINGQIDRLAVTDSEVVIIDYKTNRPPPAELSGVPAAYLYQLASYRLVLSTIFPGRVMRAAILWTDGPRLMPVSDAMLDEHARQLWKLDAARLDG